MRIQILAALLVLVAIAPGTSTALTIQLDSASTFVGTVNSEVLGPGRTDGYPNGPGAGLISIDGELAPSNTVQITELTLIQRFSFGHACTGGDGYYCLPSEQVFDVFLTLEGPGSSAIDAEGVASGELHVFVGLEGVFSVAATLLVNTFGYPITPGALTLHGVLQFDNPESPLANLQGVVLVPEPSATVLVALIMIATAMAHRGFAA